MLLLIIIIKYTKYSLYKPTGIIYNTQRLCTILQYYIHNRMYVKLAHKSTTRIMAHRFKQNFDIKINTLRECKRIPAQLLKCFFSNNPPADRIEDPQKGPASELRSREEVEGGGEVAGIQLGGTP